MGFYMAAPFLSVNGQPFLRIDIPHRHFFIFGQLFWPQDVPYFLLFVLIGMVATLTLISFCGRVFCGWLCPHNVFLEMVFRPIEQWWEGRGHKRAIDSSKRLDGPRLLRKLGKWFCFISISGALANTATAIFVGPEAFFAGIIINPFEHPSAALFFFYSSLPYCSISAGFANKLAPSSVLMVGFKLPCLTQIL